MSANKSREINRSMEEVVTKKNKMNKNLNNINIVNNKT